MNDLFKTNTKQMIFENLLDQSQQVVDAKAIIQDLENQIHRQLSKSVKTDFTIKLNPDKYAKANTVINLNPLRATEIVVWLYCEQSGFAYSTSSITNFDHINNDGIQLLDVRIDPWLNYHMGC